MNHFATKTNKPTAQEYLNAPLDQVVERLNNNPSGHQSEEALIQSVITVRAAKVNERLSKRLNWLTGILALATVGLAVAPFLTPSFEKQKLEEKIADQARVIDHQRDRITQLLSSVEGLAEKQRQLSVEVEKHNQALQPTAKAAAEH